MSIFDELNPLNDQADIKDTEIKSPKIPLLPNIDLPKKGGMGLPGDSIKTELDLPGGGTQQLPIHRDQIPPGGDNE